MTLLTSCFGLGCCGWKVEVEDGVLLCVSVAVVGQDRSVETILYQIVGVQFHFCVSGQDAGVKAILVQA